MRTVPLDELPIRGALDRDVTATGIVLRRLPSWTRHQLVDPALALLVTMPAGVRLAFVTDSRRLELDVMLTVLEVDGAPFPPAAFDLVVGDEARASVETTSGTRLVVETRTGALDLVPGEPATIRFDDLPGDASAPVEVWLPHASVVELRAVRIDEGAALGPAPARARRWVHYGSSISHCLEALRPTGTWPAVTARRAGVDLVNLAVAGQCMLDPARRPDDPRPRGRRHQHQGGHQHRQRRLHAGADVRGCAARVPRHRARRSPRHRRRRRHPPSSARSPRPSRVPRLAATTASSTSCRDLRSSPSARCRSPDPGGHGRGRRRRRAAGDANLHLVDGAGAVRPGTTSGTCPTGSTRTRRATSGSATASRPRLRARRAVRAAPA
jgi:hypothetical protein